MKAAVRTGRAPELGTVAVLEEELAKKLGRAAWLVWQIMCSRRDSANVTHVTNKGLMKAKGFQPICRTAVLKACVRLREAGLVESIGYKEKRVPKGDKWVVAKVYERKVFGARALHLIGTAAQVVVPIVTREWLATASAWGGARSGAGRPSDQARLERSRAIQAESADLGTERNPRMGTISKSGKKGLTELRSPSESESCPAPAGDSFSSFRVTEETSDLGTVINGGGHRAAVIIGNHYEGLPPFPGNSIVSGATVPHPPLIKVDASKTELVEFLMKWYRGALEAVYDIRLPRRKKITVKKKDRDLLLTAAAHLAEHEIPPAVWCAWRCDRYKNPKTPLPANAKRPAHPPLAYVFSERMLTDDRWQFRAVWDDAKIGGRVIYGKKFYALYTAYREMVSDVNNGMSKKNAVAKHFPGERYNEMLGEAQAEAVETQNKITMQIERGEYVWPL